MMRIQVILSFFFMISLMGCQSDAVADTAKKKAVKTTKAVEKVVEQAPVEAEVKAEQKESNLKEFYVERDKSAEAKKSKKSKASTTTAETTATSPKKEKTESKPAKKIKSKKAPKMKFTSDNFAFGIIKPGDVIEHKFEFTNTGTADLVITDAKATCGCTQPSFPFVPIPPGEKGFIGVKYDSTGKLGTQKPTVTLTTNGSPKTRKVYLEGLVISELAKN